MSDAVGLLSGLKIDQLRDWLQAVRRIAGLDEVSALLEMDNLAFGLSAAVEHAGEEELGSLDGGGTDWKERYQRDLAAARANLEHPDRIGAWDATHLRQSAALTMDPEAKAEGDQVATELEVGYHGASLIRALTEPIASTVSLAKQARILDHAVRELERLGRITPELTQRAREARTRLARYRAQKKIDEAAVAEAGGNAKRAGKLRAEAGVLLAQDWPRYFPGEPVPGAEATS
jgi:hypothetical protein